MREIEPSPVAVADLDITRQQVHDGEYRPCFGLRLAPRPRRFRVAEWWPIGTPVDLGDREVELLHLPGHTSDSVGLLDRSHGFMFTGDFLCRVGLGALFPTSSVSEYLTSARHLLHAHQGERLFGGHYEVFPALGRAEIEDVVWSPKSCIPGSCLVRIA